MNPTNVIFATGTAAPIPVQPGDRRFAVADGNRRTQRALVKALGKRQFKKLYRKAQA